MHLKKYQVEALTSKVRENLKKKIEEEFENNSEAQEQFEQDKESIEQLSTRYLSLKDQRQELDDQMKEIKKQLISYTGGNVYSHHIKDHNYVDSVESDLKLRLMREYDFICPPSTVIEREIILTDVQDTEDLVNNLVEKFLP